jgi:hypothetical protein
LHDFLSCKNIKTTTDSEVKIKVKFGNVPDSNLFLNLNLGLNLSENLDGSQELDRKSVST